MIEPKIDDLLAAVDSKYTLVILAAKRAREINSYYSQLGEGRGEFVPPLVETGGLTQQAAGDRPPGDRRGQGRLPSAPEEPDGPSERDPLAGRRVLLGVTGGIAAYKAAHARPAPGRRRRRRPGRHDRVGRPGSSAPTRSPRSPATPSTPTLWERARRRSCTSGSPTRPTSRVVAPATANVIAKLAHGLADDLLTVDPARGRLPPGDRAGHAHRDVGAPGHPRRTSRRCGARGARSSGPVDGPLAHGDEGWAAWPSPRTSSAAVEARRRQGAATSRAPRGR